MKFSSTLNSLSFLIFGKLFNFLYGWSDLLVHICIFRAISVTARRSPNSPAKHLAKFKQLTVHDVGKFQFVSLICKMFEKFKCSSEFRMRPFPAPKSVSLKLTELQRKFWVQTHLKSSPISEYLKFEIFRFFTEMISMKSVQAPNLRSGRDGPLNKLIDNFEV